MAALRKLGSASLICLLVIVSAGFQPEIAAENVNFCGLLNNPNAYSGKLIRVRAIYAYGFEVSELRPPECCAKGAHIWVEFGSEMDRASKRRLHQAPKDMGLALGTYVGYFGMHGPYGQGSPYQLRIIRVQSIEKTARDPGDKKTTWIPKDCL